MEFPFYDESKMAAPYFQNVRFPAKQFHFKTLYLSYSFCESQLQTLKFGEHLSFPRKLSVKNFFLQNSIRQLLNSFFKILNLDCACYSQEKLTYPDSCDGLTYPCAKKIYIKNFNKNQHPLNSSKSWAL